MEPSAILSQCLIFYHNAYRPKALPAEYGGSLVISLSIHLSNGEALSCSSLELEDASSLSPEELWEKTLERLKAQVQERDCPPRCDYLDLPMTLAWRDSQGLPTPQIAISACLLGERCRYDGDTNLCPQTLSWLEAGQALPVCPELFGGLPIPRPPCEIQGERIVDIEGKDRSQAFRQGAVKAWEMVQACGIKKAVLKARSPSCGRGMVYDGSFSHRLIPGDGWFAGLLGENGVEITTEEELFPFPSPRKGDGLKSTLSV